MRKKLALLFALIIIAMGLLCFSFAEKQNTIVYGGNGGEHDSKGYLPVTQTMKELLSKPSSKYNPELAEVLMGFAYAAYNREDIDESLKNLEFTGIWWRSEDATGEEHIDSLIGFSIANKHLDNGKTVVLICVRGTIGELLQWPPAPEWQDDLDYLPDEQGRHNGFAKASEAVVRALDDYLARELPGENPGDIIYVVTGHSRGAAVANLVEVDIARRLGNQRNIYGYNFACPDAALSATIDADVHYNNIFNFNLASDPISYLPGVIGDILGKAMATVEIPSEANFPVVISDQQSMLLEGNWGKYGTSYWYAKNWLNASDCALNFASHSQINYLLSLRSHPDTNVFMDWWNSRAPVYYSTFNPAHRLISALYYSLFGQNSNNTSYRQFPIDGTWVLTGHNGNQYKVRFRLGDTNMLNIINRTNGADINYDSYFIYRSASSTFLVDINGLTSTERYIFSAADDDHIEVFSTNKSKTEKLYDLTRVTSAADSDQTRPVTDSRAVVLVLDTSGSMDGDPMRETKQTAANFIGKVGEIDTNIGIVSFESTAKAISPFGASIDTMTEQLLELDAGGGTNIEAGLTVASEMLNGTNSKTKIIILMSDGEPESGKTGDDLVAYADELKSGGIIIYTLGFFSKTGGNRASAQRLMERIAGPGYHYEIDSVDTMQFLFGDVADQLNGQRFIFIRIECPVDVSVSYNGETLDSTASAQSLRTSFGVLSFEDSAEEEIVNDGADRRVKVLRLKEGASYPIRITGTGAGQMCYSIGLMGRNGEYSDFRRFEAIPITNSTVIDTVAQNSLSTTLSVDNDGDGKYDATYMNTPNGQAKQFTAKALNYFLIVLIVAILAFELFGRTDEIVVKRPSMRNREE